MPTRNFLFVIRNRLLLYSQTKVLAFAEILFFKEKQ
jgi:hypothetical protein